MAATQKGRVYTLDTANDTLAGKWNVNSIIIVAGATGGTTTLKVGGTSGITIYSQAPTVSVMTQIFSWSEPQILDDLFLSAVGTNVTVVVFTC